MAFVNGRGVDVKGRNQTQRGKVKSAVGLLQQRLFTQANINDEAASFLLRLESFLNRFNLFRNGLRRSLFNEIEFIESSPCSKLMIQNKS